MAQKKKNYDGLETALDAFFDLLWGNDDIYNSSINSSVNSSINHPSIKIKDLEIPPRQSSHSIDDFWALFDDEIYPWIEKAWSSSKDAEKTSINDEKEKDVDNSNAKDECENTKESECIDIDEAPQSIGEICCDDPKETKDEPTPLGRTTKEIVKEYYNNQQTDKIAKDLMKIAPRLLNRKIIEKVSSNKLNVDFNGQHSSTEGIKDNLAINIDLTAGEFYNEYVYTNHQATYDNISKALKTIYQTPTLNDELKDAIIESTKFDKCYILLLDNELGNGAKGLKICLEFEN